MKYLLILFFCGISCVGYSQSLDAFIRDVNKITGSTTTSRSLNKYFSELSISSGPNTSPIFSYDFCKSNTPLKAIQEHRESRRQAACMINPKSFTFSLAGYNFYPACGFVLNNPSSDKILNAFEKIVRQHGGVKRQF